MRTAGGHQRSEGPQRAQGGWQAEPPGVSSHSVPLPDQVWVWAQAGGAAGKVECLWERMVGFRGGHRGEGWRGQPGRGSAGVRVQKKAGEKTGGVSAGQGKMCWSYRRIVCM